MKKIVLSVGLLLALIIGGCDQLEETSLRTPMGVNVEGYVFDGVNQNPIKGAIISGSFGTIKSNADGLYRINGLDMGQYRYTVEADGYMTTIELPLFMQKEEDFKGDVLTELWTTYMYKKNQPISTQLVEVAGPVSKPLSGIPYTIELNGNYKDRFIYGSTNANGMLVDTVPNSSFTIIIDTVINNIEYALNQGVVSPKSLIQGYAVTLTDLSITPVFMVSTNVVEEDGSSVMDFDPTVDITADFNQALNTEKSVFTLEKYVGGTYYDVKVDISYSDGNKHVVISPFSGDLAKGQQYRLNIQYAEAASNENASYNEDIDFVTRSGNIITSLTTPNVFLLKWPNLIVESTTTINAQLTIDKNSSNIEVYGRYVSGEEFVKFSNVNFNWTDPANGIIMINNLRLDNFPNINYPAAGIFSEGNDFELMIRSYTYSNGELVESEFSSIIRLYKDMAVQ